MTTVNYRHSDHEDVKIDLKDPRLAAFFAWLVPGAGHFYQRRFAKGFIFLFCIFGTFLYGLVLGEGRSVYASFRSNDFRWQFICQAGVGAPALFAVLQRIKTDGGNDPFLVLAERYPEDSPRAFERVEPEMSGRVPNALKDGFMAPPPGPAYPKAKDVLAMWHVAMKSRYDVATIFTVLAGLLNVLAIYDAFAGPAIVFPKKRLASRQNEDGSEDVNPEADRSAATHQSPAAGDVQESKKQNKVGHRRKRKQR